MNSKKNFNSAVYNCVIRGFDKKLYNKKNPQQNFSAHFYIWADNPDDVFSILTRLCDRFFDLKQVIWKVDDIVALDPEELEDAENDDFYLGE